MAKFYRYDTKLISLEGVRGVQLYEDLYGWKIEIAYNNLDGYVEKFIFDENEEAEARKVFEEICTKVLEG